MTRLRDLGWVVGRLAPGPLNAISDVPGVRVGHSTLNYDTPGVARTGVTVVSPFGPQFWEESLFAGFDRLNGFGEVTGAQWIEESGLLTSPIALGSTAYLGVLRDTLLALPLRAGVERRSHQPVCAETNDGLLNDGLIPHLRSEHVIEALNAATDGPVEEGNVGGGTGMTCHEFKGGVGTSSRLCPTPSGSFVVGTLVQANYGLRRNLSIDGIPVGRMIDYDVVPSVRQREDGSIIIIVATDAPLLPAQCRRLAKRASLGLARAGGFGGNTSGDFAIAFSTAHRLPAIPQAPFDDITMLPSDHLDPLFHGVVEAVEEAIANALVAAVTMTGRDGRVVRALPHGRMIEILHQRTMRPQ